MLFYKDSIHLEEFYNIKLNDSLLEKLEDGVRKNQELLITIAASHYGMLNGNVVVYRHDTVRNNIGTFIHPSPKPVIENHNPKTSKKFGSIIAVDYKETSFYNKLASSHKLEDLTTLEYMNLCKDHLIPFQKDNSNYDGLGYCEVVAKLNDSEGIKKVLEKEFFSVSIGADPKKLVCSDCLQDQVISMCNHFPKKEHGIFMLAEELEYEELSFLRNKKPADPYGKVTRIHDGKVEEFTYELENNYLNVDMDAINIKDFFKLADKTKTIVCMDNICKVINREEKMAKPITDKKPVFNISYTEEFSAEKLAEIKLSDSEEVKTESLLQITDEEFGNMKNSDFAIVQKTEEGTKRRFPIHNEISAIAASSLLDQAIDLSPAETLKAKAAIERVAKKLGIEVSFDKADNKELTTDAIDEESVKIEGTIEDGVTLQSIVTQLKGMIESIEQSKLTDAEAINPITTIFEMLKEVSTLEWVSESIKTKITDYLEEAGQVAFEKDIIETMTTEVASLKDELQDSQDQIDLLEDLNRDLNVLARQSLVDEIVDAKDALGLLKDSIDAEKTKLFSHPYNVLAEQVSDYRQLKAKLKDNEVNNNKDIKSIVDPTLQDAIEDENDEGDQSKITLSEKQIQALFKDSFSSYFNK